MTPESITADGEYTLPVRGETDRGYRVFAYSGDLGGGTLRLKASINGLETYIPDSDLDASTVDGSGNVVTMFTFVAAGDIIVELDGSTGADIEVVVL